MIDEDTLVSLLAVMAKVADTQHEMSKNFRRTPNVVNVGRDYVVEKKVSFKGSVGAVAMDEATQFVGQITQQIGERLAPLQNNQETKPAADALAKLAEAIKESKKVPSERERGILLADIDELATQAALPKEERKKAAATPLIDRLAGFCGGIGGLATLWQVAGPALLALF